MVSGCVNTTGQLTVRVEKSLSNPWSPAFWTAWKTPLPASPRSTASSPVLHGSTPHRSRRRRADGDHSLPRHRRLGQMGLHRSDLPGHELPCALVLSVPLAFFAGIGAGSKRGILFKGGQSMEAMSKIKAVIMDKTGTITKGDFTVQKIVGGDELLELCADCEQQSTHPIAESIVAAAKARNMELRRPEETGRTGRPGHPGKAGRQGNSLRQRAAADGEGRVLPQVQGIRYQGAGGGGRRLSGLPAHRRHHQARRGERRPCPCGTAASRR